MKILAVSQKGEKTAFSPKTFSFSDPCYTLSFRVRGKTVCTCPMSTPILQVRHWPRTAQAASWLHVTCQENDWLSVLQLASPGVLSEKVLKIFNKIGIYKANMLHGEK